jgi:hypothetical protein
MIKWTDHPTAPAKCDAHAAPMGGAGFRLGRGCGYGLVLAAGLMAGHMASAQQSIQVPSGQAVVLNEVLVDDAPGEVWVRFRFLAPRIARQGGDISPDQAAADLGHLCDTLVLPYLADYDLSAARVVLSMSDREVPFGASDPDATQFFEAYRPEPGGCEWEAF